MEPQSWARVDDAVKHLGKVKAWDSLWWQVLALPVPQAVAAARHLKLRKWHPAGEAEHEVARVLVEADARVMERAVGGLLAACSRTLDLRMNPVSSVGFAYREPVVALDLSGRDHTVSRVVTVDRNGIRQRLYEGPATHWSLCCIDAETVVARREWGGGPRGDTEVVEYTPRGEVVLASGSALLDGVVRATAHGFVLGMKLTPVVVALADGQQEELDLSRFGMRGGWLCAVDAAGTRAAFASRNRVLVTDARLQPLCEHVIDPVFGDVHLNALAFTEDALVTCDYDGNLARWVVAGDRLRRMDGGGARAPRGLFRLSPVPAWGLLVGEGGNENFFFDPVSLERVALPRFLGEADRVIGRFSAAAHSPLAAHESQLFPAGQAAGWFKTAVHDLAHPLNALAKPIPALRPGDGAADGHALSGAEAEALAVVRRVAALRPRLESL